MQQQQQQNVQQQPQQQPNFINSSMAQNGYAGMYPYPGPNDCSNFSYGFNRFYPYNNGC